MMFCKFCRGACGPEGAHDSCMDEFTCRRDGGRCVGCGSGGADPESARCDGCADGTLHYTGYPGGPR